MADDGGLKLTAPDEDGRGTSGWLAFKLGVSDQTIRNWHHDEGMPSCGRDTGRGRGLLFDLKVCREWRAKFHPATLHGGKRPRAGRPPKLPPAEMAAVVDAAATKESMRESAAARLGKLAEAVNAEDGSPRIDFDNLSRLTEADLKLLAYLEPGVTGFNAAQATRLQQLAKSQRDQMEIAEQRGNLHDAAACTAAKGAHLRVLRNKLEGLPGRAAPLIVAAAKMDAGLVPVVKAALMEQIDQVIRELAEDPMGARAAA